MWNLAGIDSAQTEIMMKKDLSMIAGEYCKFEKFREDFIFVNSVKRHICHV